MKASIIAVLVLWTTAAFGQLVVKQDGGTVGPVSSVNCIGPGITCTRSGSTWVLSTDGGSSAGISTPHLSAARSTDLSVSYNTTTTIPCDTESFDTDAIYDSTTGIATIATTGYYRLTFNERVLLPASVRYQLEAGFTVNGTAVTLANQGGLSPTSVGGTGYDYVSVGGARTIALTAGDEVRMVLYQVNDSALSVTVIGDVRYTYLEIQRIR